MTDDLLLPDELCLFATQETQLVGICGNGTE